MTTQKHHEFPAAVTVGQTTVRIYRAIVRKWPYFSLSWYRAGKRTQRLIPDDGTEKSAREAMRVARDIAEKVEAGAITVNATPRDWRELAAAREALLGTGYDVAEACREFAQALEITGSREGLVSTLNYSAERLGVQHRGVTVPDLVELYIERTQKASGIRHLQDVRSRLRRFAVAFRVPISEVKTKDIQRWLDSLEVSPTTRSNFAGRVRAFFSWARANEYLPRHLPTEADYLDAKRGETEIELFAVDEVIRVMKAARDEIVPYLAIGFFAGLRSAEISKLRWEHIRFDHRDIEVGASIAKKTRKRSHRRLVPMESNLFDWLWQNRKESGRVAPATASSMVSKLATELRLPWKRNGMRHTYISMQVAKTGNVDQVALWAGNSRDIVYSNYLRQVTKAEAQEYFAITPASCDRLFRVA